MLNRSLPTKRRLFESFFRREVRRWRRQAAMRLFRVEKLEDRRVLASVSWDGGGDGTSWGDAANWVGDAVPGVTDDVTIDVPGDISVVINAATGNVSVNSLEVRESLTVTGATLNLASASTIDTLGIGSTGTVSGDGDLIVGSATLGGITPRITGTGSLSILLGADLNGTLPRIERVVENAGLLEISSPVVEFGASLNNLVGGEVRLINGADLYPAGPSLQINNAGTFTKTGSGFSELFVGVELNNTGTIHLEAGQLDLRGGGSTTQSIEIPGGTTLNFRSSFGFAPGADLFGGGVAEFSSGTFDFSQSQFLVSGTANFRGGNYTFANTFNELLRIGQFTGTFDFIADQFFNGVTVSSATLQGAGNVYFLGASEFRSVTLAGTGTTYFHESAVISLGRTQATFSRPVFNAGIITNGSLRLSAELTNEPTGTVEPLCATMIETTLKF